MPRYAWVIVALSPRDGGWVRFGNQCRSEELGWKAVEFLWDLMVLAGDYVTVDVKKTISFR